MRWVGSSVVEQRPFKPLVVGSNPTRPTIIKIQSPRSANDIGRANYSALDVSARRVRRFQVASPTSCCR